VKHRREHALVPDSASAQLRLDHTPALREESIDLDLCGHESRDFQNSANLHPSSRIMFKLRPKSCLVNDFPMTKPQGLKPGVYEFERHN
jgi:hypothetical protein